MKKVALFAFNGEGMCFIHVLLNALDMNEKGYDAKIVIEGAATKLVPELAKKETPFFSLYKRAKSLGIIEGACKACCQKMGTLEDAKAEGLALLDDMSGHPSISGFIDKGFEVMTF